MDFLGECAGRAGLPGFYRGSVFPFKSFGSLTLGAGGCQSACLYGQSLDVDSSLSEPDCSANAVLCVLGGRGHPSASKASAAILGFSY